MEAFSGALSQKPRGGQRAGKAAQFLANFGPASCWAATAASRPDDGVCLKRRRLAHC
mgnify:CR=1 FL=1